MLALVRSSIRNHYNTRVHSRVRVTTRTSTRLAFTPSPQNDSSPQRPEHAVISTFDLFSIGVGPSSSHTVGPMRAGKIFITDLEELNLLSQARITLFPSCLSVNEIDFDRSGPSNHHTPQAILLGLEGSDPETIHTGAIPVRYESILATRSLLLGGRHRISYNIERDMVWHWDHVLKTHPNGMRFSVFGEDGELLATNEYFSVGGGFVVNEKTKVDENMFYKAINKRAVHDSRLQQSHSLPNPAVAPSATSTSDTNSSKTAKGLQSAVDYPFFSGDSLLALTKKHNVRINLLFYYGIDQRSQQLTIAQIVHDNEKSFGYSDEEIYTKIMKIWSVMDECIHTGVTTSETTLPGRLGLRRRAPNLYKRLLRGIYPGITNHNLPQIGIPSQVTASISFPSDYIEGDQKNADVERTPGLFRSKQRTLATRLPRVVGSFDHAVLPMAPRKSDIPAMDFLSCYAIAVNEVNASGGRIVTSPTNGAAGVIPAVLKYIVEFLSDDPEKSVQTFLLTASAIGMLFKRGSTISAAEGGCQAEVGVACSMASAGFAACMGGFTSLQAAEIGIEHNLGLTCDPIDGLVQVPCIERNSLGDDFERSKTSAAVKAITAAQLSMASDGVYSVTLDEAIEAMRLTAQDMSVKYKETSLSGLAKTVKIPLSVPAW
ncbi:L-serine dehydratase tdcG [Termitomyces sp. J132]|nr:L-serine dehydratase tdcG [Termitomyces sp. J132]